jgi:hypothetical protein
MSRRPYTFNLLVLVSNTNETVRSIACCGSATCTKRECNQLKGPAPSRSLVYTSTPSFRRNTAH